ncbi:hypothetical protein HPULCUR_003719 [Helicostylum pulchrum]|uniref:Uncharacterized protein n=1 Tax=Helicostylum pulchrum TaxID=562976 RepID=A0ABP9XU80_9FUNG
MALLSAMTILKGTSVKSSRSFFNRPYKLNLASFPGGRQRLPRLAYGHKCDLVFRQYDNVHNLPLERGGSEVKPRIEKYYGTNFLLERFIKLPRMLKDMRDVLLKEIEYDNRSTAIRTVGVLHSGL